MKSERGKRFEVYVVRRVQRLMDLIRGHIQDVRHVTRCCCCQIVRRNHSDDSVTIISQAPHALGTEQNDQSQARSAGSRRRPHSILIAQVIDTILSDVSH